MLARAFDEKAGQRGETGADLDEVVAGTRIDRVDDLRDVVRIDEEVLPEPLACDVPAHR